MAKNDKASNVWERTASIGTYFLSSPHFRTTALSAYLKDVFIPSGKQEWRAMLVYK